MADTPPIVVQKYGGSSVADAERLGRVAERVAETVALGKRVVVVVSAMGDTTDELLALARTVTDAPPRRELDMLLTAGERISMALLSMALQKRGVEAISFTGSQSGIVTNDAHAGARIIEVRPFRIQDELARDRVVIVAGYQGVSYKREITTLGRGGSDTTAVALAAALGAEYCEICSDVDGVFDADPRIVEDAERLTNITPDEMAALSEAGAKVLNSAAVGWARDQGMVIWARATLTPPSSEDDGTVVRVAGPPRAKTVAGVTSQTVRLVTGPADHLAELEAIVRSEGARPLWSFSAGTSVMVVVPTDDLHNPDALAGAASDLGGALSPEYAAVSLVGRDLDAAGPTIGLALKAAREIAGAPLHVVRDTTRLTMIVGAEHADEVVRAVHAAC